MLDDHFEAFVRWQGTHVFDPSLLVLLSHNNEEMLLRWQHEYACRMAYRQLIKTSACITMDIEAIHKEEVYLHSTGMSYISEREQNGLIRRIDALQLSVIAQDEARRVVATLQEALEGLANITQDYDKEDARSSICAISYSHACAC